MARGRKRTVLSATMEEQIQKAQEKVIKTKASYDAAVKSLQVLLDKRDAQRSVDCQLELTRFYVES